MASFNRPGVGSVGQYQISAQPYVSRTTTTVPGITEISFPYVSRFVTVVNTMTGTNRPLRVGFSNNGISYPAGENYFVLDNGESYTGEWRLASVFVANISAVTASFTVIAGLTGIISTLSGTSGPNFSGSAGVG
jgi:hypothetical protein